MPRQDSITKWFKDEWKKTFSHTEVDQQMDSDNIDLMITETFSKTHTDAKNLSLIKMMTFTAAK